MSETFNRYAPNTIKTIPTDFAIVGISPKLNIAIKVVNIGVKDAIGETRDIEDLLIALKFAIKATTSIRAAKKMNK